MSIGISPLIDYALIQNKTRANDKLSILDILAVDELGRQLNIEVQTSIPAGLAKRLAYHTCVSYSRQLKKGQNYLTLRPSISICVLNTAMFANSAKWFLRNVDQITVQDVARLFPDRVFFEAAGVLQMISKIPEQLMEYDARLKYQRDQSANKQEMQETKEALEATRSQLAAAAT